MKNCEKCGYSNTVINITIKDAIKELTLCPNCLAIAFMNNRLHFVDNPTLVCDVTSEKGAVEFISDNEYYCLNSESMMRLISHNLTPHEYFVLVHKYNPYKFMLHDDFYDEDGFAIQPMGEE